MMKSGQLWLLRPGICWVSGHNMQIVQGGGGRRVVRSVCVAVSDFCLEKW